jgi:hypothetical protein
METGKAKTDEEGELLEEGLWLRRAKKRRARRGRRNDEDATEVAHDGIMMRLAPPFLLMLFLLFLDMEDVVIGVIFEYMKMAGKKQ